MIIELCGLCEFEGCVGSSMCWAMNTFLEYVVEENSSGQKGILFWDF